MRLIHDRRWAVFVCVAALAGTACRQERASVEELYTTRTLALGFLQRNQLAEAETAFKKLIELVPDDPFAYANLGFAYLQAGRFADAEKQLNKAHKLDPEDADVELALARLYSLTKRESDARAILERLRRESPANVRALYALSEMDTNGREARLREILAVAPANLAARIDLIDALAARGEADSAVRHLEEVRRIPPALSNEAAMYVDSAIQSLRAYDVTGSRATLARLRERLEVTMPYQASLAEVKWTEGPLIGRPTLTFAPRGFVSRNGVREEPAVDVTSFSDATSEVGIASSAGAGSTAFAVGDIDGDGDDDVFFGNRVYRMQKGSVRDSTDRLSRSGDGAFATFADYDNDGWLDLLVIGSDGAVHLYRNRGSGTFEDATNKAGIANGARPARAVFVDLDHDGDLDILIAGSGPSRILRNNLDGSFTESAAAFGFAGVKDTRDAAFADFDNDGHIDVFLAGTNSLLMQNRGAQRFADATRAAGLGATASSAVAVGDYDNDGSLDLLTLGTTGADLWHNRGNGTFARDQRSAGLLHSARDASAAAFFDYDNDGWLDIVLGGRSLFRNDGTGKFIDRSRIIQSAGEPASVQSIAVSDVDTDGDEDLWLVDGKGARVLRNDGGNSNLAVNVELKALTTGSGKNNTHGIGAKLELSAGKIFQTRVATGRVTHFGLGPHLKADVLRVEWPNGVPQSVYFPGADQDVVESETLKGSCALAYTWDGKQFRFATDAMWRSALGMPLGLMGGTSAFAPAGASQEYVRIDGNAFKPRNGRYVLQLTEELWETAYADEVKLVAIDHPDSVDVFVDERFVPPGPVSLRLFQVPEVELPRSAVDERGIDVLYALREVDDVYVSNFVPTKYQGVVESHDLIMDLGPNAGSRGTSLFLRGWIYPTDASINVALSQQSAISISSPSLEVRDANGKWRTVIANIGFPSGKDKTLIIALDGKFPTADHHVRIRTNMQIYWDKAFVARTSASGPVRVTTLKPVAADLHYRGFSRMYRKGGRYGPYWFAYDDVTAKSPWRPITGEFTRFGDVLPLLETADDMYAVMGPGDEATIEFDASSAESLPRGWKRDFLLYTDGWIKDSDLNTAFGTTVGPLPFHDLKSYPYGQSDKYPADQKHQRYLRDYNTRVMARSARVDANVVH